MRPFFYTSFFLLLLAVSCKKTDDTHATPPTTVPKDFALIPMRNATWVVHTAGWYTDPGNDKPAPIDLIKDKVDSAVHSYYTIVATGIDTMINGFKYYRFISRNLYTYNLPISNQVVMPYRDTVIFYLREDTLAQTVFLNEGNKDVVDFDLKDQPIGTKLSIHPEYEIKYIDSLRIAGMLVKRWQACNSYDKSLEVLYKAYGLGIRTGPMPWSYTNSGSKVRSLDFSYKGDNLHLDFNY